LLDGGIVRQIFFQNSLQFDYNMATNGRKETPVTSSLSTASRDLQSPQPSTSAVRDTSEPSTSSPRNTEDMNTRFATLWGKMKAVEESNKKLSNELRGAHENAERTKADHNKEIQKLHREASGNEAKLKLHIKRLREENNKLKRR
jgi:hypothetical protein